ncbi:hypothetical protein HYT57_03830 [Candidatus Woesearchaeota archaeon]|nr:hypothetical protein [Candidatus Woesearchaeota archaeon]
MNREKNQGIENVRFLQQRANCKCRQLDELWGEIGKVDDAQSEAQDYAEEYTKNKEKLDKDPFFKRAFWKRMEAFNQGIERYQAIFVEKVKSGDIVFESGSKKISYEEALDAESVAMRCAYCNTGIPHLKYPGWNE